MFTKYIIVGLFNTLVTGAVIFFLMYINIELYTSNAIGYIVGIFVSFILNSSFTFKTKANLSRFTKFIICSAISYLANIIAIKSVLFIYPNGEYIAQLFGMGTYTVIGFLINKLWVMK